MSATTVGAALGAARQALRAAGVASAGLDSRLLLAEAAGLDMAALIARSEEELPAAAAARFDAHLRDRLSGMPVARILGTKEFWGLSFALNAATLEPRPDTETLVEAAVAAARRRFPPDLTICDLGTGSGAILIALLHELPQARGVGTDVSEEALAMARQNAERLGVGARARFALCEFADGPIGLYDIVVSNPPYIRSSEIPHLAAEVRDHDPRAALDGGPDGLAAYRAVAARGAALLAEGGMLAVEVGEGQAPAVAELLEGSGFGRLEAHSDLAGVARVLTALRIVSEPG